MALRRLECGRTGALEFARGRARLSSQRFVRRFSGRVSRVRLEQVRQLYFIYLFVFIYVFICYVFYLFLFRVGMEFVSNGDWIMDLLSLPRRQDRFIT